MKTVKECISEAIVKHNIKNVTTKKNSEKDIYVYKFDSKLHKVKFDKIEDLKNFIDFTLFSNTYEELYDLYTAYKSVHSAKHCIIVSPVKEKTLKKPYVAMGIVSDKYFDNTYKKTDMQITYDDFNIEYWKKNNWI